MRPQCPKCKKQLVVSSGPEKSKILLVGEFPGKDEIIQGHPFVGITGDILRQELLRLGANPGEFRVTNLWLHAKDEKGCDVNWHRTQLMKEFKGRKLILLMGSDLTKLLFGRGVLDLTGLEVESKLTPARLFVSPNPAILLHGQVGEFRLALDRFIDATKEIK